MDMTRNLTLVAHDTAQVLGTTVNRSRGTQVQVRIIMPDGHAATAVLTPAQARDLAAGLTVLADDADAGA